MEKLRRTSGTHVLALLYTDNGHFAASHSRGRKPPCWRAKVALGRDKQRKLPFKIIMLFLCLVPVRTFPLYLGDFVPREWLAAKGLLFLSTGTGRRMFYT